jgi:hypothetical protein
MRDLALQQQEKPPSSDIHLRGERRARGVRKLLPVLNAHFD